jgi:hypothetical protein
LRRALCLLRSPIQYRRDAFNRGLQNAGFKLATAIRDPGHGDCLVIWNRYGGYAEEADRFERAGAAVLVAENGYLPNLVGRKWYALALGHHNGAGSWSKGGPDRWDALGADLGPWQPAGGEVVILGQRGIGEKGLASPDWWAERTQKRLGGRIREHPARGGKAVTLEDDLREASAVVTWGSAAAIRALVLGVPVWYDFVQWIGAKAAKPLGGWGGEPERDDAARLAMLQRLIWAQWTLQEIESGEAITMVLAA